MAAKVRILDGNRVESDLGENLARVDGWLTFAEAENLAIIALTLVLVFGLASRARRDGCLCSRARR